jgi:hypothetical protein
MSYKAMSCIGQAINIRQDQDMLGILEILLKDRTTGNNIIWANDNYSQYGNAYGVMAQIKPKLITNSNINLVKPRASKTSLIRKSRTKTKAEVFTPIWIVKQQNDLVDDIYKQDDLETYTSRTWLEVTCGEAPYMATRYDMCDGKPIQIDLRVGFVDRKLKRINKDIHTLSEWQRLVQLAYQASYGFEWSGDSLLIARENLLYTYVDYYIAKWGTNPSHDQLNTIATIISYNVFQMDGLTYTVPLIRQKDTRPKVHQLSMDGLGQSEPRAVQDTSQPILVKIPNWTNQYKPTLVLFVDIINKVSTQGVHKR